MVSKISKLLDEEFDIDIIEKHHKYKLDKPSGTAKTLSNSIINYKNKKTKLNIHSIRSANILGEHEILFTSKDESLSIKHIAFSKQLFAKGALKIIDWLVNTKPKPNLYLPADIFLNK